MTGATSLSAELALAAGCTLLDDEQLAAALDDLLASPSLDWDRFLAMTIYHGVEQLSCARVDALRPGVLPEKLRSAVQRRSLPAAALHASQTRTTSTVLAGLQKGEVPALVLKGTGVAHLLYAEHPELRSSWDIDILVAPEKFRAAEEALREIGLRRTWPAAEPPPRARSMLLTLANVFDFQEPGVGHTIELHCRATMNPHALAVPFDELHASSVQVATRDGPLRTLDGPLNIAYLCHHTVTSYVFRLKWFGDIARAERRAGGLDCASVVASDPRALPQRPAQLVSQVLRHFERQIEQPLARSTIRTQVSKPLVHVMASMEHRVQVNNARNLARLPVELANLRFVLGLLPDWRAKAYEWLRFTCDPRDALTLQLAPGYAWLYAFIGPVLALLRYAKRKGRPAPE